jgi:hypothetical protein
MLSIACQITISSMIADEEVVARFRREAFFLARAKSDYVAKIYEFINDPQTGMVLVMEFIEGESLAQIFDRRILTVEGARPLGQRLRALAATVGQDARPTLDLNRVPLRAFVVVMLAGLAVLVAAGAFGIDAAAREIGLSALSPLVGG